MPKTRSAKFATAAATTAGALTLSAGLAVAGLPDHASTKADDTAAEHVTTLDTHATQEAGQDSNVQGDEHEADDANEVKAPEAGDETSPTANHGAAVSSLARSTEPGPEHGKTVSTFARGDHGGDVEEHATTTPTATRDDEQAGDNEVEADDASEIDEHDATTSDHHDGEHRDDAPADSTDG